MSFSQLHGAYDEVMTHSVGQRITALLVPVFLLAALAGTLLGGVTGGLMTALPYLGENDQETRDGLEAWSGLASYTMFTALYGAVAGLIYGLVSAAGAIVGLAVLSAKRLFVTVNQQALASALGAAAGSLFLVGAIVAFDVEAAAENLGIAAAFVLATFVVALIVGRLYLGRMEARDSAITRGEHADLLDERYGKH